MTRRANRQKSGQNVCWYFANGTCTYGNQCWFLHQRQDGQLAGSTSGGGSDFDFDEAHKQMMEHMELAAGFISAANNLKEQLRESQEAKVELEGSLKAKDVQLSLVFDQLRVSEEEKQRLEGDLKVKGDELCSLVQEKEQLQAEVAELKQRIEQSSGTLCAAHGSSSSQLPFAGSLSGAEWSFESAPGTWSCLPSDSSAQLLRHYQEFTKGGQNVIRMRSGVDEYDFDFAKMSQTNTRTSRTRAIKCSLRSPEHWTRCVNLESVYQATGAPAVKVSNLKTASGRLNGEFFKSDVHLVFGKPSWWKADGSVVMYSRPDVAGFAIVRMTSSNCVGIRAGGILAAAIHDSTTADPALLGWGDWKVWSGTKWTTHDSTLDPTMKVHVRACSTTAQPLMDFAEEIHDEAILNGPASFCHLLQGSVVHHTPHHGASACEDFKRDLKIVRLLRLENFHLWTKYMNHLEQVRRDIVKHDILLQGIQPALPEALRDLPAACGKLDPQVSEHFLFHGTDYETAVKIAFEGFDFRLSKPGYYGKGTYFASQACKSHQYATKQAFMYTMLLCRVVVGDVAYAEKVDPECIRPPVQPSGRRADTLVAKPGPMPGHAKGEQTHQEFIIFQQHQAYPEFLIQYTCGD